MEPKHDSQNLSMITCFSNPSQIVLIRNYEKSSKDSVNKMLVINRSDHKIVIRFLLFRLLRLIPIRINF